MNESETFFDKNSDYYSQPISILDYYFLNFINEHKTDKPELLDIGGGNGVSQI